MSKLVDLSIMFNTKTPVYPGDPAVEIVPAANLEADGYNGKKVTAGNHIGTHIEVEQALWISKQILYYELQKVPDKYIPSMLQVIEMVEAS